MGYLTLNGLIISYHVPASEVLIRSYFFLFIYFSVHYVTISLLRDGEVQKTQETKSQSGFYPIWNQPFLFDLSGYDVNEYSLDFVVMRGKLHTKDTVIGHVTIGQNGCRSGKLHWKDILSPRPAETAKWHSISPVLGSKVG